MRERKTALTAREMEVIPLLCLSNESIAGILEIKRYTVEEHVSNIMDKLLFECHVRTRTRALVVALRDGLIQPDEVILDV